MIYNPMLARKLPNKLSSLIRVAVRDLRKVEKLTRKYKINMGDWHQPNSHCSVCFAGGVMAMSLGAPSDSNYGPGAFSLHNQARLYALNSVRTGSVAVALRDLGVDGADIPSEFHYYDIPPYRDPKVHPDRNKEFYAGMRGLAKDLQEAGF